MTRKNSLLSLALLSIGLLWASCTKSDDALTPLQQTQNEFLANGGIWKADSSRYVLTANIAGRDTTYINEALANAGTLTFHPIDDGDTLKPGHHGLRRGLVIRNMPATSTSGAVTDTMNWQIASGPTANDPLRLVLYYKPESFQDKDKKEEEFSFKFIEKSSSKMVIESNRAMSIKGQPGHGHRRYVLMR